MPKSKQSKDNQLSTHEEKDIYRYYKDKHLTPKQQATKPKFDARTKMNERQRVREALKHIIVEQIEEKKGNTLSQSEIEEQIEEFLPVVETKGEQISVKKTSHAHASGLYDPSTYPNIYPELAKEIEEKLSTLVAVYRFGMDALDYTEYIHERLGSMPIPVVTNTMQYNLKFARHTVSRSKVPEENIYFFIEIIGTLNKYFYSVWLHNEMFPPGFEHFRSELGK
jgi:hypothetical protein